MPVVTGECALCLSAAVLCESHLLPAALYKLAKLPTRKNPHPVVLSHGVGLTTSKQIVQHLLCRPCESRFSQFGEDEVLATCRRGADVFPLRAALEAATPVCSRPSISIIDVGVSSSFAETAEHYLYFAASIFWRASRKGWRLDGRPVASLQFPPDLAEALRLFLLRQRPFPDHVRLMVHVWRTDSLGPTSTLPSTSLFNGLTRSKFCVPGIAFILFSDATASERCDAFALGSSPRY